MSDQQPTVDPSDPARIQASGEIVSVDGQCYLSNRTPQKPTPSMGFCFRNNISSCCVTLHDVLIADDFASFMPSACVQDYPEWEILACYGCHFTQPKTMYINEFYTPDKPR